MSSTSDTINIKGNRKVVRATYYAPESVFKIPDGLDLEDESVVKFWGVKYNTLHIHYVDGREEELEPYFDAVDSSDYKYPQETEIEDADDCNVDYSEDEDEEEESKIFKVIADHTLQHWRVSTNKLIPRERKKLENGFGFINEPDGSKCKVIYKMEEDKFYSWRPLDNCWAELVPADIVFYCFTCKNPVIRDSETHDHSKCDPNAEDNWYCPECPVPDSE